jgi:hypothetical protein
VALPVNAFDNLAISLRYAADPDVQTSHPGSRATSWLLTGDHLADRGMAGASRFQHWFTLAGLEVARCEAPRLIVALGDSITDGHGATDDANDRWTDGLAQGCRPIRRIADGPSSIRASAAIACCMMGWGPMLWRGLTAMCWSSRACGW